MTQAKCNQCGGSGWVLVPEHHPYCQGDCALCPVPAEYQCDKCEGRGWLEAECEPQSNSKGILDSSTEAK